MGELVASAAPGHWHEAATAIMTTDTFPKGAAAVARLGSTPVTICGIAKGAGMIAPDMGTMLSFAFTDAEISPRVLQALLKQGVVDSFNAVTIDGDTSTSDTLLAFATGAARIRGAPKITSVSDPRLSPFRKAFDTVLQDLAEQVARDGEGARKLVEIVVEGAVSKTSARKIALSIANSPLVKTAIAGEDANWGRVVMAVGRGGCLRGHEEAGNCGQGGARAGARARPRSYLRFDEGICRHQRGLPQLGRIAKSSE
jgi:glutamate N-acetyltransferase/amino-acid N-acetyltransferase